MLRIRGKRIRGRTFLFLVACALLFPGADSAHAIKFEPSVTYPTGFLPAAVAIGDVTSDGRNDVLTTTNLGQNTANKLFLFAQAPDASLAPKKVLDTAIQYSDSASVVIGDLTGDGQNDAAVGTRVGIDLFPQANGTLSTHELIAGSPTFVGDLEIADMNADGAADLVVNAAGGVSVLTKRQGQPGFDIANVSKQNCATLATGDLNGDKKPDIVAVSAYNQSPAFRLYIQQSGGGYLEQSLPLTPEEVPREITVADVTGDGREDIVATRGGTLAVYPQLASGQIDTNPQIYPSYEDPEQVKAADMNGDGRTDVVTLHAGHGHVGVYLQHADGRLGPETLVPFPSSDFGNARLALGDVNSDGHADIAAAEDGLTVQLQAAGPPSYAPTLTDVSQADRRIAARWTLPAGMAIFFIEIATSPDVNTDGPMQGLFLEGNTVLFDDSLTPLQLSYTSTEQLPPGTYYVHVADYSPICAADDPLCTSAVSASRAVVIPSGQTVVPQGAHLPSVTTLPALTATAVRAKAKAALKRRYGRAYTRGKKRHLSCSGRSTSFRCKFRFTYRRKRHFGRVVVESTGQGIKTTVKGH